jgi:adenosylmethionine-8-amino-7-oxononanoate aminotransferase
VVEPVGGAASGAMVPVPEYYPMVREICNKHDVLLIVDECVSGFGRTGMWFSIEHWNVQPDILTMAKGMTGAYAPLGGMAIDESIVEVYEKTSAGFVNPFTTAGNPVSCAVCKTVFDIIERDNLVERSAWLGEYLYNKAKSEISHHASVGDIRGKGMLLAIELVKDKKTREPFAPSLEAAVKVKNFAMEQGCIIYPSFGTEQGVRGDLLLLAPPYIITEKEIDWALDVIDRAFEKFEKTLGHK